MTPKGALLSTLVAAGMLFSGCGKDSSPSGPDEASTWQLIQHEILASNCVSCHSAGTSFARQSGLVLTEDVAYSQLVNVTPRNQVAADDGLVRISDQGLAGLYKSFLWEKINAPDQEHFYADHPLYGTQMPLGDQSLTSGQLEFIRQWILAGAPETGVVADPALLANTERYEVMEFFPLPPPANGIQLHLGPFDVPPQYEREVFSYMPLNNAEDIFVNGFELAMQPGSHHFIMYVLDDHIPAGVLPEPEVIRDLRDENEEYTAAWQVMPYQLPIAISQLPRIEYYLPPGVAIRLPAGTSLDLNSHYANRMDKTIQGEAYANLHLLDASEVVHEAQILPMSNFDIKLPPGKVTTLEDEFVFDEARNIVQLVSHAHDRMVEFRVEVMGGPRDGELVYVSYDWEHPPLMDMDPPLAVEKGQGLRCIATYDNWTDRELNFGLTRDNEMMILYAYFYTE